MLQGPKIELILAFFWKKTIVILHTIIANIREQNS